MLLAPQSGVELSDKLSTLFFIINSVEIYGESFSCILNFRSFKKIKMEGLQREEMGRIATENGINHKSEAK